jgi:hypothetical protein
MPNFLIILSLFLSLSLNNAIAGKSCDGLVSKGIYSRVFKDNSIELTRPKNIRNIEKILNRVENKEKITVKQILKIQNILKRDYKKAARKDYFKNFSLKSFPKAYADMAVNSRAKSKLAIEAMKREFDEIGFKWPKNQTLKEFMLLNKGKIVTYSIYFAILNTGIMQPELWHLLFLTPNFKINFLKKAVMDNFNEFFKLNDNNLSKAIFSQFKNKAHATVFQQSIRDTLKIAAIGLVGAYFIYRLYHMFNTKLEPYSCSEAWGEMLIGPISYIGQDETLTVNEKELQMMEVIDNTLLMPCVFIDQRPDSEKAIDYEGRDCKEMKDINRNYWKNFYDDYQLDQKNRYKPFNNQLEAMDCQDFVYSKKEQ